MRARSIRRSAVPGIATTALAAAKHNRAGRTSAKDAGSAGPLDPKVARLVKLGIQIATPSEGGTHSAVRKAQLAGARPEEIYQVVALAAGALGLPNAVAAFTWVRG